jgi:predicted MFS family arabinose efflux permease
MVAGADKRAAGDVGEAHAAGGLSDTQLGLLTGFAFAAFYATLGIPIARLADRTNRRNLIAIALTVWSAMTALSGLAGNFWHLLAARVGVEWAKRVVRPGRAMIADYYPIERRATALASIRSGFLSDSVRFLAGG